MDNSNKTAHADVARWMVGELDRVQFLYQEDAVWQIIQKFGPEFAYENVNGNWAIDRRVLKEFRALTGDKVVWERGERMWRKRADFDEAGKRQQD